MFRVNEAEFVLILFPLSILLSMSDDRQILITQIYYNYNYNIINMTVSST